MVSCIELQSERLRLRTTKEGDRSSVIAIRKTDAVRLWWRGDDLSAEFAEDLGDEDSHQLTIEEKDNQIVGLIQFSEEEDPDYRHATLDIYVDPSAHRKGYATEAIKTVIEYLFAERDHHRLTIDPAADNTAAVACYRKIGFQPVGRLREYERRADGVWIDGLLMELLRSDRQSTTG